VTLYESDKMIGGQFNMAKRIPGKEEFYETLRYFNEQIKLQKVNLQLNTLATAEMLKGYDIVVLATGVHPRQVKLPKTTEKVKIVSYLDVLKNDIAVGKRVAVIGAGGIGYDVSEFLLHEKKSTQLPNNLEDDRINEFLNEWNISKEERGGLKTTPTTTTTEDQSGHHEPIREIFLMQRKSGKFGKSLGKTTGWIHRSSLKKGNVKELSGCTYLEVNDNGLLIEQGEGDKKKARILDVDTVVICAGQESHKDLLKPLQENGKPVFLIGGSQEATELDAKRAIDQGTRLAANIENAKSGEVFNAPISSTHQWVSFFRRLLKAD
jgi:2,4-dienoyl-CoA reductase (NADPH2)